MKPQRGFLVAVALLSFLGCREGSSSPDGGGGSSAGATGGGGTIGSAGTTGAGGAPGSGGSTGGAGTTGSAGSTGGAGTTGTAGTTGSGGTTGGAGRGGTTGSAGTSGGAGRGGTTGSGGRGGTAGTGGAGGGTCSYGGTTYPVGASFPDVDGCNTCGCTAGGQIACTERACPPDAGAPACVFDTTYQFGMIGGRVAYQHLVTLSPSASYVHSRYPSGTDPYLSCSPALPACNSTAIDVSDVMRDIADPDVQRALAAAPSPIYGLDTRPVDGAIFNFVRINGSGFLAGSACAGTSGCVEIPNGVARLVATLRALDEQQLKDASCAPLR